MRAAGITYIPTGEGVLYLAGIVDLFSRKIIGWSMKGTLHTDLCMFFVGKISAGGAHRRAGAVPRSEIRMEPS